MSDAPTRACSRCGYELTGLPGLRGTCPECGQFWDVLTGKGTGDVDARGHRRSQKLINRLRTIAIALFAVGVMICGGAASFIASNPWRPIAMAGMVAVVALLAAATSYACEDE